MRSPRQGRTFHLDKMHSGNFPRIFPFSPPPFQVGEIFSTDGSRVHSGQGSRSIVQLHKDRMIKTEKNLGSAFSKAAKNFIGTKANDVWEDNDAFGMGKEITAKKTPETLKSILKKSQFQNNVPRPFQSRPIGIGKKNRPNSEGSNAKEKRRVSFDPVEQIIPTVTHTQNRILDLITTDSTETKRGNDRDTEISAVEMKVVRGYAFLSGDGDKAHRNTFALPKPKETLSILGGGFQKQVNMEGFLDNEIYFETDDYSVLVVTGLRTDRDGLNPRKVIEMVEFPQGTYHETLLISRDAKGILTIQANTN